MSIFDLLPMLPFEGPPLPRFLGIVWPWVGQQSLNLPKLPSIRQYITDVKDTSVVPYQAPLSTYQNEESWSIEWSPEGMPTKIVVSRHAERQ